MKVVCPSQSFATILRPRITYYFIVADLGAIYRLKVELVRCLRSSAAAIILLLFRFYSQHHSEVDKKKRVLLVLRCTLIYYIAEI